MTYSEKLKDPRWQKKRLKILQRDNWKCVICGDSKTELHVHHKKYNGEPYESDNKDLQTLCKDCHRAITIWGENFNSSFKSKNEDGSCFVLGITDLGYIFIGSNGEKIGVTKKLMKTIIEQTGL